MNGFDIRAVSLASALQWARGEIHDTALDSAKPEIVFWNELDNLTSYRAALREVARLRNLGCPAMIVHACNAAVVHKLLREGCVCSFVETIEWRGKQRAAGRYIVTPLVFNRWVGKWA